MNINFGRIVDVFHDKEREIISFNIENLNTYNNEQGEVFKFSTITNISVKQKKMDKSMSLEKLSSWKNDKTVLGYSTSELDEIIAFYDGDQIHPVAQQKTVPLSFFNKRYLKGYESIVRWVKYGAGFSAILSLLSYFSGNPVSILGSLHLIFILGVCGFLLSGTQMVNYFSMKNTFKRLFQPDLFDGYESRISLEQYCRRSFLSRRNKINTDEFIAILNKTDISATEKILLQDKMKDKEFISYKDIKKISKEIQSFIVK